MNCRLEDILPKALNFRLADILYVSYTTVYKYSIYEVSYEIWDVMLQMNNLAT